MSKGASFTDDGVVFPDPRPEPPDLPLAEILPVVALAVLELVPVELVLAVLGAMLVVSAGIIGCANDVEPQGGGY